MIREVELIEYLPEFMQQYREPVVALAAENPEFANIWNAVHHILYNHFLLTADEYGISRFEKLLGIYPNQTDTLEIRRTRVRNRWFSKIPYTVKSLREKFAELLGGEDTFSIISNFEQGYELLLKVYALKTDSIAQEITHIFQTMLPTNMQKYVIYSVTYPLYMQIIEKIVDSVLLNKLNIYLTEETEIKLSIPYDLRLKESIDFIKILNQFLIYTSEQITFSPMINTTINIDERMDINDMSIRNNMFIKEKLEDVVVILNKDEWYLDGTFSLDGTKQLDSKIVMEEI